MKKIYTIRNSEEQDKHLWAGKLIEEEYQSCSFRNISKIFLRYLPKEGKFLEAGCGLGGWVLYLKEKGYDIKGIDNNKYVIRKLNNEKPSLNISEDDICRLKEKDCSLDAYITLGVLEHFEKGMEKPLGEAYRALKYGGLIFLTVPYNNLFRKAVAHPLRSIYLFVHKLKGGKTFFSEYRYNYEEIKDILQKTGFEVIHEDVDDFEPKTMSLGIYADFPMLHGGSGYQLNLAGKIISYILNSISRKVTAEAILLIGKK